MFLSRSSKLPRNPRNSGSPSGRPSSIPKIISHLAESGKVFTAPDRPTSDPKTGPMLNTAVQAPVIADMEIARVIDDLDALDPTERCDALRFLLMNLGWLAASGVYGTATALQDTQLLELDREEFLFALQELPMFALEMLHGLEERLGHLRSSDGDKP